MYVNLPGNVINRDLIFKPDGKPKKNLMQKKLKFLYNFYPLHRINMNKYYNKIELLNKIH